MYQDFYNFTAEPFRLSPDHDFAYSHKGYTKARAYMEYAFMRAEGFVMITGRPGTGKTTLIGALLDEMANTPVSIANLVCTQLQADDLLKMVAYEFGIPVAVVEKGELLQHLTQQLKAWHREGRRALLIVDEAQDLSVSAMEELRLLTNIQVDSRPLLQIFLLGQPELRDLILSPRLEQVHQRIIAASHIEPLESDETGAYIRHRLETVNWRGDPAISKSVYPLIYKFSEGVPRRINLICSRLLLHCAVEQRHQVTVADVREVIGELQGENLASGKSFSENDFLVEDIFEEPPPAKTVKTTDTDSSSTTADDEDLPITGEKNTPDDSRQINRPASGAEPAAGAETGARAESPEAEPAQSAGTTTAHRRSRNGKQGEENGENEKALEKPAASADDEAPKSLRRRKPRAERVSGGAGSTGKAARGTTDQTMPGRVTANEPEENPDTRAASADHTPPARASWTKIVIIFVTVTLLSFGDWN